MNNEISIICVYNQLDVVEKYLISSLSKQNINCEHILIDNRDHLFSSAASALNYGAKQANGKYLIFVHQDIEFLEDREVTKIIDFLKHNPESMVGSAGVVVGEKGVYTTMLNDADKHIAGDNIVQSSKEVDVLDECIIACSKETFSRLEFDEQVCDGWDLYAVELCMHHKLQGGKTFVLPTNIWHVSPGYPKHEFYKCARKLCKIYRNKLTQFQSCCITIPVPLNRMSSFIITLLEILHYVRR